MFQQRCVKRHGIWHKPSRPTNLQRLSSPWVPVGQGRWAYACTTAQDIQPIVGHCTDATELHMVKKYAALLPHTGDDRWFCLRQLVPQQGLQSTQD